MVVDLVAAMARLIEFADAEGRLIEGDVLLGCITSGRILGLPSVQIPLPAPPPSLSELRFPISAPMLARSRVITFTAEPIDDMPGYYAYVGIRGRT